MKIHLVRHGQTEFREKGRICLGRLNLPLSRLGHMQGALLGRYFSQQEFRLMTSGLLRANQTAAHIGKDIETESAFAELDVGEWDGLPFSVIRERWPEIYAARGENPYAVCMPGGEAPQDCLSRARTALDRITGQGGKDVVIVAHAGVIRLLLCSLIGKPMQEFLTISQPYGCVNTLVYENGAYTVERIAMNPVPELDDALLTELLNICGTPEPVRRHMRAVEQTALALAQGLNINKQELSQAALLHDVARTEKKHAQVGADILSALGYGVIAEIIACHHELSEDEETQVTEKTLLYLADKYVRGEETVTLAQRFAASEKKLDSIEARQAHARRYAQALRVEKMILDAKRDLKKGA